MATYIVRKAPSVSADGSSYGPSMVMVHTGSSEAARVEGAQQLGVRPSEVIVEPFADPLWGDAA